MASSKSRLTFADIQSQCGLADISQAEDLCIDCMQSLLLKGKIDQLSNSVTVEYVSCRDPDSSQLNAIHHGLKNFASHAASVAESSFSKAAALNAANVASKIETQNHIDLVRSKLQNKKEVAVDMAASGRSFISKGN